MRLGNWIFTLEQMAQGLSPVLYNVYTNGLAGQWFKPGVLYNVYTNGLAGQWFKPGVYACGRQAYLQNSQ